MDFDRKVRRAHRRLFSEVTKVLDRHDKRAEKSLVDHTIIQPAIYQLRLTMQLIQALQAAAEEIDENPLVIEEWEAVARRATNTVIEANVTRLRSLQAMDELKDQPRFN